jgi:hypothetical protein
LFWHPVFVVAPRFSGKLCMLDHDRLLLFFLVLPLLSHFGSSSCTLPSLIFPCSSSSSWSYRRLTKEDRFLLPLGVSTSVPRGFSDAAMNSRQYLQSRLSFN